MATVEALIRTRNEEEHIAACIENARTFCDRITVLDQHSTDRTVEIARAQPDVRVELTDESCHINRALGYGVERSEADWILCLDADMRLTPPLTAAFREIIDGDEVDAVDCRVKSRFFGRWIEHGNLYRPHYRKLYRRRTTRQSKVRHHHFFDPLPLERVRVLRDRNLFFLHYAYDDVSEFVHNVFCVYARNEGREFYEAGERSSVLKMLWRPARRFLIDYLWRGGWKDGPQGLMVYGLYACYEFVRWASCYAYGRRQAAGEPPSEASSSLK